MIIFMESTVNEVKFPAILIKLVLNSLKYSILENFSFCAEIQEKSWKSALGSKNNLLKHNRTPWGVSIYKKGARGVCGWVLGTG